VKRALLVVSLVAPFVLPSCKQENPPAPAPKPPTLQEAEQFGKAFAAHMVPCKAEALDRDIDLDLLVDRAVAGRSISPADVRGLKRGMGSVGTMLCSQVTPDTTYTFLRTQTIDGTPRPLFRMLGDEGVNYHSLELDKQGTQLRAADLYVYMSGEQLSSTFGGLFDLALHSGAAFELSSKVTEMKTLMQNKQLDQASDILQSLPSELRNSKPILLLGVQIASGMNNDPKYVAAIDAYAKAFPNDPSLDLVMVDGAFLRKKYDEALTLIERLDKRLGGDPYLESLRASALAEAGKYPEAIAHAKQATQLEPTLRQAWWALLTQQAAGKDYGGAVGTIEVLRDRFGGAVDDETLRSDARFGDLVVSKEYLAWRKAPLHRASPAPASPTPR
jgi:tetratricopeptide (TPR) repeat protein